MTKKELTQKEFAQLGNKAQREKYPKEVRAGWSRKAKDVLLKKYGPDYYKQLAQKSVEARMKRKQETQEKPLLNKILGIK